MRTHYFFLLTILFFLCKTTTYAQKTFEQSFGGPGNNEWQDDLKKMKRDGYLVTGSTSNFGAGNYDAYCVRLNEKGKMLWSKTYGTSLSEAGTKCYGTKDGGFLLSFNSYLASADRDSGVYLVKCDEGGTVQWSKCIKDRRVGSFRPAYLYESKQGDYYLLYDWSRDGFYGAYFALLKFTSQGTLVWEKQVDTKPLSTFGSIQITELDNGNIIVCGNSEGDNWATYGVYIHVFRFAQKDGAVQQSKKIGYGPGGAGMVLYADNIVVQDGSLYFNGGFSEDGYYSKICWFPVDSYKGQVNAHYVEYSNYHSYQYLINRHLMKQPEAGYASRLIFTPDGGYLNAYRYSAGSPTYYDIIVDKHDSLGRICPQYKIPVIDTVIKEMSFQMADKSYALLANGVTILDLPVTATAVTAQRGICGGSADVMADRTENSRMLNAQQADNEKPKLYPNPATDVVTVVYGVFKPSDIQVAIMTVTGNVVMTKHLFANAGEQQIRLDVRSLPAGIYCITITGSGTPKMMKMIKQ